MRRDGRSSLCLRQAETAAFWDLRYSWHSSGKVDRPVVVTSAAVYIKKANRNVIETSCILLKLLGGVKAFEKKVTVRNSNASEISACIALTLVQITKV